ncbi:hypothetical protein GGS20DRAFT_430166 [Poronia punctata]|nr:hypothetical protein GGS20DRAFT_430166 [Poronia punctata]
MATSVLPDDSHVNPLLRLSTRPLTVLDTLSLLSSPRPTGMYPLYDAEEGVPVASRPCGDEKSRLLRLPAEIRVQIIHCVVVVEPGTGKIWDRFDGSATTLAPPALAHVNRQLREEVTYEYYTRNHFALSIRMRDPYPLQVMFTQFTEFLSLIPSIYVEDKDCECAQGFILTGGPTTREPSGSRRQLISLENTGLVARNPVRIALRYRMVTAIQATACSDRTWASRSFRKKEVSPHLVFSSKVLYFLAWYCTRANCRIECVYGDRMPRHTPPQLSG